MKLVAVLVLLVLLLVSGCNKAGEKEQCELGVSYDNKNECYCPANKIKSTGVPTAIWAETGDGKWECIYLW